MNRINPFDQLIGARGFFFEEGEDFGGVIISPTVRPDALDTTSNENDGYFGCIQSVGSETDTNEQERKCTSETGVWRKNTVKSVEADYLDLTIAGFNELSFRQLFGLTSKLVDGVCQIPFNSNTRTTRGWFYLEGTKTDGSGALITLWVWVDLDLSQFEGFQPDFGTNEFRLEVISNALNQVCGNGVSL